MDRYDAVDWLCTVWGAVGTKQTDAGRRDALANWEALIDIVGYTEYCVSNAGDFANMEDLYPKFQNDAVSLSRNLGLTKTAKMFEMQESDLLDQFDQLFISVCLEIKAFVDQLPDSGAVGKASSEWKPT